MPKAAAVLGGPPAIGRHDFVEEAAWELESRTTARAIHAAGEPDCKQTAGWWAVDRTRGLAVPRNCKRWNCPSCRRFKRLVVLVALQHGLAVFREEGREVHAVTLTDGHGDLDFASYYAAWNGSLRRWLQRRGYLHAYATALEVQPESGRLHSHTLVVAPSGADGFIPHDELSAKAADAGLGYAWIDYVADIPGVENTLPGYFVTDKARRVLNHHPTSRADRQLHGEGARHAAPRRLHGRAAPTVASLAQLATEHGRGSRPTARGAVRQRTRSLGDRARVTSPAVAYADARAAAMERASRRAPAPARPARRASTIAA